MAEFHSAGLYRVQHLQPGYDFAGRKDADLELAVGDFGNPLGEEFGAAEERIQALGPTAGHAPVDAWQLRGGGWCLSLDDGRRGGHARGQAYPCSFKKRTTFHNDLLV